MNNIEKDLKVQIPSQAWITSLAIMDMDDVLKKTPDMTLKEYIDGQIKKTNIWADNPECPIYNVGTLFMMAYVFLVVPKESIEKYGLTVSSDEIEKYLNNITIRINEEKQQLERNENIIRHLRNAISHANIDIVSENDGLHFVDKIGTSTTFDGEMKINDFKALLVEFYKTYYKCYHEKFIADSE